jgi:hypothetical protein
MSLEVLKNEKNIKLNKDGVYEFEHVLVQGLDQINVNAIIESNKSDKERAEEFIEKYEDVLNELKNNTKKETEKKRDEFKAFLEEVNKMNKEEKQLKALEYFDKMIETKKRYINDFDNILENSYKQVESFLEPQKDYSQKTINDAEKTLELWEQYYKELSKEDIPKEELPKEKKSE